MGCIRRSSSKHGREGSLKSGNINETKVIVPFRKEVDLQKPDDCIAIDINESNVTGVSSTPHILRIDHELRTVHTTYFCIRRRIQKLAKFKPKKAERLMKKYSGREKRKAMDICHKISRAVVDFAKEHGFGIVMENLKGIRNNINKGRMLSRRLHSWNFARLQFYIDYKARLEDLPVEYVNPRGTSSLCPVCGEKLALNGHRRVKCDCGYEQV